MNYEDIVESFVDNKDNFIVPKTKITKDRLDDFEVDIFDYDKKYID